MILIYITLCLIIVAVIARPFTTLFHELGHALAFFAFTRKGSDIFIGSYGDKKKSFRLPVPGLNLWLNYNPLQWQYGLCRAHAPVSATGMIVSAMAGVAFSLIAAIIFGWLAYTYNWHDLLKLIFLLTIASAIIDLVVNLRVATFQSPDGHLHYSDGYLIKSVFADNKRRKTFYEGSRLYQQKKYAEAAAIFEDLLKQGSINEAAYVMAGFSQIALNDPEKALQHFENASKVHGETLNIQLGFASLYSKKNDPEQSILFFNRALDLDPENALAMNNLGYQLLKLNRFAQAISYFDNAIKIDPAFAFAFNNRGHAKIETGELEDGLKDVEKGMQLNNNNSYGYRNMGIYFLKNGQRGKALEYFEKAKEIDPETDDIDSYILRCK